MRQSDELKRQMDAAVAAIYERDKAATAQPVGPVDIVGISAQLPQDDAYAHQRRGIQSATEAVQDMLDGWPGDLNRPDVYDAVFRAREALWEAKRKLEGAPLTFKGEVVVMGRMGGTS